MTDLVERLMADELPGERQRVREARIELFSLLKEAADRIEALEAALREMDAIAVMKRGGAAVKMQAIARRALEATDDRAE